MEETSSLQPEGKQRSRSWDSERWHLGGAKARVRACAPGLRPSGTLALPSLGLGTAIRLGKLNSSGGMKQPREGACSWRLTQAVRGSTPSRWLKKGVGVRSVRTPFYPFTLVNLDDKGRCLIPLCMSECTEIDNPGEGTRGWQSNLREGACRVQSGVKEKKKRQEETGSKAQRDQPPPRGCLVPTSPLPARGRWAALSPGPTRPWRGSAP